MCGEQPSSISSIITPGGSPPRVRGTGFRVLDPDGVLRITPACAGNSETLRDLGNFLQDHPRVCGEQSAILSRASAVMGSPPRVRGTAAPNGWAWIRGRITPACAGNSFLQYLCGFIIGDHPRVCGEQPLPCAVTLTSTGSPPRVRGTVRYKQNLFIQYRITPACAGNSGLNRSAWPRRWDHPRVCGEQVYNSILASIGKGSPPRVRGTVGGLGKGDGRRRITPACAGNRS